jgi:hypothetical protein
VSWAIKDKDYSQRHACRLVGMEPKTHRYASTRPDDGAIALPTICFGVVWWLRQKQGSW